MRNISGCCACMLELFVTVESPRLDKDVKVTILGCFGDIALAIGEHFERYVHIVMSMLTEASTAAIVTNPQDYDQVDYVDKLRENCVTAYTGILQGMRPVGSDTDPEKKNQAKQSLSRFVQPMCEMIAKCCETQPVASSDALVATVAGLIGDLVVLYGTQITPTLSNDKVGDGPPGSGTKEPHCEDEIGGGVGDKGDAKSDDNGGSSFLRAPLFWSSFMALAR
ncbi:unnamed protein product [Nippostrongylus brasiliensis]|uniref:Importin subunit beta-1 (inferred by orthology to a human protein) n=1 Tax=Nippostrongylus brasiliensis TaxID=27835 RepID=A0A0N4XYL4_NIPBR|nr:unnamed protein product [Nippostrongylus brasiliensis]